jgi:hypothetical protein
MEGVIPGIYIFRRAENLIVGFLSAWMNEHAGKMGRGEKEQRIGQNGQQ